MFRGAIILGLGFTLGYGKALHDAEEITDLLKQLIDELKKQTADKVENANKADAAPVDADVDAVEVTEPPVMPPHPDKDAVDDAVV